MLCRPERARGTGGPVEEPRARVPAARLRRALGAGAYLIIAVACLPIGLLHVLTGVQLRKGRGLILTIVSLAASMISMVLALYCSPLTLAVVVYAVVVLLDPAARKILEGDA